METNTQVHRGFTLLIAVVLSTVALSVAIALLDVAYKQVVLALTARSSQYAFYAADAAIECALYYDQQFDSFNYSTPAESISCKGQTIDFDTSPNSTSQSGGVRTTVLTVPCGSGTGSEGSITVYKWQTGVPSTQIFGKGYSSCDPDDPRRVERGLKVQY